MPPTLRIFDTPQLLFSAAADEFASRAQTAIHVGGRFTVALSGGSTPKSLYAELAAPRFASLPWEKIFFFWGDERHVPPDHAESNYRMVKESLLSKIAIPQRNVFRLHAEESDATQAAAEYECVVRDFFHLQAGQPPRFDLILLGLGPDGHTASLFPGSPGLNESRRLVIANRVERMNTDRLTFTYPVLNAAACDMFLVSGENKKEKVRQILRENADYPASHVKPQNGELLWFLDRSAAAEL